MKNTIIGICIIGCLIIAVFSFLSGEINRACFFMAAAIFNKLNYKDTP